MKSILISQTPPKEKSPYTDFVNKYGLNVDFFPFIDVEGISAQDFRQKNINLAAYEAVIFSTRSAIDHYFRICEEMRFTPKEDTRFFCPSEAISLYIQKYTVYRKRKIFFGKQSVLELTDVFKRNKDRKFLIPTSEIPLNDLYRLLARQNCQFEAVMFYQTVPANFEGFDPHQYGIITFFSPNNVQAFAQKNPKFSKKNIHIACFGDATRKECEKLGWKVDIFAPTKENPSMVMAIDGFLQEILVDK